jgi:putative tryptophan/tyrosine transport system substrate-binding protein
MRRREVIAGWLIAFMALPAMAQPLDRVRRVGLLMSYTENDQEGRERLAAFREALRDAGWVDGGNTRLDARWYAGQPEQAMVRARELVELAPDLIVVNGSPGVATLKRLTNTIPIVFATAVGFDRQRILRAGLEGPEGVRLS